MTRILLAAAAALSLAACTPQQLEQAVVAGQLFCAVRGETRPVQEAMPGGAVPVIATGASKARVDAACAAAGGVTASPPAVAGGSDVLTIPAGSVPL